MDGVLLATPNLNRELWNNYPIRAGLQAALGEFHGGIAVRYLGDGQAAALGEYSIRSRSLVVGPRAAGVAAEREAGVAVHRDRRHGAGRRGGARRPGDSRQPGAGRARRAHSAAGVCVPLRARSQAAQGQRLCDGGVGGVAERTGAPIGISTRRCRSGRRTRSTRWKARRARSRSSLRELVAAGDPLAQELFDDQARALGITLLCVNYLGDYDRLVIGGGVCAFEGAVRERYQRLAEEEYRRHALDGFRNLDRLEYSVCGDEAPVIGALAWAMS